MKKKLNYFTAIQFLSKYFTKYKQNFIMFYVGWLFITILSIVMPILFGIMIDEMVYYQNIEAFISISLLFVVLMIFICGLLFLIYFQHSYLLCVYGYDIRMDILKHYYRLDPMILADMSSGTVYSAIMKYSVEGMFFIVSNMVHASNNILLLVGYAVYLLVIDWRIGLVALVAAPFATYINAKYGKKIRAYGDAQNQYYNNYIGWMLETLTGLRDIRMLNAKAMTDALFKDQHRDMFAVNVDSALANYKAQNIMSFVSTVIQLCIFALAGHAALSGSITVGTLTIVVSFYGGLVLKTKDVSNAYLDAQNRITYIQQIYDILELPTESDWQNKKPIQITKGEIEFKDISFSYPNRAPLITNLNLTISSGERLALVGKSGCGKSTLANMLIGFYHPNGGSIVIDGQDIADYSLDSIRQNIGLVRQDVLLADGTIRQNITLGNKRATDDQIEDACRAAELWEFIKSLKDGIDTIIGTDGIGLSGGQKQRIAMARIYLKNPKIIIFDEATSALDNETEQAIHSAWQKVLSSRTSIIIAHRQNSVMLCERVAIIEDGQVIKTASPELLAEEDETFRTLFAIKGGEVHV